MRRRSGPISQPGGNNQSGKKPGGNEVGKGTPRLRILGQLSETGRACNILICNQIQDLYDF
jgi:hypothetical protein